MSFCDSDSRPPRRRGALTGLLLLALGAACAPTVTMAAGQATGSVPKAAGKAANANKAQQAGQQRTKPKPPVQAGKAEPSGPFWAESPAVLAFAEDLAARQGLPQAWVLKQLSTARRVQAVRELIMPPPAGTAKNWSAYRARFIEPERIAAGVAFWDRAAPWLRRAEQRWGVPSELVVGIIGVETFYGRVMGNFKLIDALSTLAFDFPPGRRDRSDFFKSELESLLVQSHAQKRDPHSLKGSYAGATGLPQFMPSSVARWAVDFDDDGRIDLQSSLPDVVGSVAHYLASFGWQQGQPTHHAVTPPPQGPDLQTLLAPDIVPSFSAEQMAQRGAVLAEGARASPGLLALVELQNGDAPASYVAGTQNFYVVTRYNWSSYYAMAVIDLGAAVAEQRRAGSSSPAVAAKTAPKTAFKAAPKATRKAAPAAPNPRPQTKAGSR